MRFKIVPEPPTDRDSDGEDVDSEDTVERARRAIPLVPASEEECCGRLMERLSLPARDAAREWLTFCRALGLAVETDAGFRRRRERPSREELSTAFRERVYGVREVLDVLDESEEPLSAGTVAERFAEHVPQWERFRYPSPEEIWGERAKRILDWAVYFGLAERADERYRSTDDAPA